MMAATVEELSFPLVIPHRGGANVFPENTMAAFEAAEALGAPAIEAGDIQLTADGALVAMHDATVDRTTSGFGNVADHTLAGLRTLRVDASTWFGGHWTDQPVPTFAEILDRFGGSVVLVPESKSAGSATTRAMIDAVVARNLQRSVIIQSFRLGDAELCAAAGIASMLLMETGAEAVPAAIVRAGAGFVGLNKDAPDLAAVVRRLKAAGLRVLAWTVDTQSDHDGVMAAGCDGIFSNENLYATRNYAYRTASAPWPIDGTFGHGMLVYPGVGPLIADLTLRGGRGGFIGAPGAWRWTLARAPYLAGPVCPVPAAEGSYTVTVQLVYDTPPAADATCWAGVYIGVTTDDCPQGDPATGYLVALRWDGTLQLCGQPADGSGMVGLAGTAGSPIVTPMLVEALSADSALTSLTVSPITGALEKGQRFVLPTGQVATLSDGAARGAMSLPVEPLIASAPVAAGTPIPQEVTLTIAKTPTGVTATRSDDAAVVSCTDTTWSGGYLFLRNAGDGVAAVSCAHLSIG